jgi:polyphenol oxidase
VADQVSISGTQVDVSSLPVLRFESLQNSKVVHGVTTRTEYLPLHGNMSYMVGNDSDLVRVNRTAWAEAIGYDPERLVLGRQVHETTVLAVGEDHAGCGADSVETSIRRVDGLMTNRPELPIGVMAADCVPILIYDPVTEAVAAIHAGWRGTVDGIAGEAVESMRRNYGSEAVDLTVCLGPAICVDCYQVGDEVIDRWESSAYSNGSDAVLVTGNRSYFNLREANRVQLVDAGVLPSSIEVSAVCTRCANGTMFSRRGLGPRTGLFTAVIMLAPDNEERQRESQ